MKRRTSSRLRSTVPPAAIALLAAFAFVFARPSYLRADETPPPPEPAAAAAAESALARARELITERRYGEARHLLDPLRREFPDHPAPYLLLGTTYYEEKRWESAMRNFRRLLELRPTYHKAHLLNGWCLYYLGDLAASRAAAERYLEQVPGSGDARLVLGLIALDEDRLDEARRQLTRALASPDVEERPAREALIRARLADLHLRAGELEQAKLELWRALRLEPGNEKFYFKLSRVLQRLGDGEGADLARRNDPGVLARIAPEPTRP